MQSAVPQKEAVEVRHLADSGALFPALGGMTPQVLLKSFQSITFHWSETLFIQSISFG